MPETAHVKVFVKGRWQREIIVFFITKMAPHNTHIKISEFCILLLVFENRLGSEDQRFKLKPTTSRSVYSE
jgi:hypothetical protein